MEPEQSADHPGEHCQLSPVSQPPKRKRGAQPGNTNALKHGLYAQHGLDAERGLNTPHGLNAPHDLDAQRDNNAERDLDAHRPYSQAARQKYDFEDPDLDIGERIDKIREWLEGEDDQPTFNLTPEIEIMRLAIRRLAGMGEPQTFAEAIHMIRALSLATSSLARLVRTQHYVTPRTSRQEIFNATVDQALHDIAKEKSLQI